MKEPERFPKSPKQEAELEHYARNQGPLKTLGRSAQEATKRAVLRYPKHLPLLESCLKREKVDTIYFLATKVIPTS